MLRVVFGIPIDLMRTRVLPLLFCLAAVPGNGLAQDGSVFASEENRNLMDLGPDVAIEALTQRLLDLAPDGRLTRDGLDYAIQSGAARGRSWRASEILSFDLDRDGTLSADEVRRHGEFASAARKRELDGIMTAADADGDGALSAAEIAEETDRDLLRDWTFAEDLLLMDVDGDGAVTTGEIPAFVLAEAAEPRTAAGCAWPAPSSEAEIVLVGGYRGGAVPSVTVMGQDRAMSAARIVVEEGERPLYVVALSQDAMIWQVEGATDRVEAFVTSDVSGVAGIGSSRPVFLDRVLCLPQPFAHADRAMDASARVSAGTGRAPDVVVAGRQLAQLALPSGRRDPFPAAEAWREGGASPRAGATMARFLDEFPGGLLRIDPGDVAAGASAEPYEVPPHLIGLVQLLESGAIEALDGDGAERHRFRLVAPFPRFPAGLVGPRSARFLLAPGIPLPDGDPGHSRIVEEATGVCLSRTPCDR